VLTNDLLRNRKQASGHKIVFAARELPLCSITIDELSVAHSSGNNTIDVELEVQCAVSFEGASSSKPKARNSRHYHDVTHVLTVTSDLEFIDFRRIP
jgi:ATP-dependent DNA helicase HFM1/MER3